MNTAIWRSLLWKEWREHRWKLAALVVVVIGLHVWALDATEPEAAHYVSPFWATLYLVVPIGSVFLAISLAASEQSQGTAPFLRSLPINLRWLAVIKLVISVATIVAVLSLAAALTRALVAAADAYGWQSDEGSLRSLDSLQGLFEIGGWFLSALLIGGAVSASLILWMAAPAVNSKSEVRAGAIGLIVIVGCWTLFAWVIYLSIGQVNVTGLGPMAREVGAYLAAMLPGGILIAAVMIENEAGQSFYLVIPYLFSHVPLACWYITRFGRTGDRERARLNDATQLVAPILGWLGPARRSPLTALVWKHARECAPIVLAGAAGAIGLTITLVLTTYSDSSHTLLTHASGTAMSAFMMLGCCAGLVSGAGVLTSELEPRLYTFWRTRPISIDLWFAIAFVGGLVLLVVFFGVPIVIADHFSGPRAEHWGPRPPLLAILILSYASGAFTASFVRNPVYASILGFCVMMIAFASVATEWIDIPTAWLGVATLAVSAALGVAAWVCVRNDWSLRLS